MLTDAVSGSSAATKPDINLSRPLLSALEGLMPLGSASHYEDEIFSIIDHILLFEDLGPAEISQLCRKMDCFSAKRGDVIMKEERAANPSNWPWSAQAPRWVKCP